MNNKKFKYDKHQIFTMIFSLLAVIAFFLPFSSGVSATSLDGKHSFQIFDIIGFVFQPDKLAAGTGSAFYLSFVISAFLLVLLFFLAIVIFVQTLLQGKVGIRRALAVVFFVGIIFAGMSFNSTLTEVAKTGNNLYEVYPEFKIALKTTTGSVNNWVRKIDNLVEEADEVFAEYENKDEIVVTLQSLSEEANGIDYSASDATKKKYNQYIFESMEELIEIEDQEAVFTSYFKNMCKSVSNISNVYGIGFLLLMLLGLLLTGSTYTEKELTGFRNTGISVRYMYIGVMALVFFGTLLLPIVTVPGTSQIATGFNTITFISVLMAFGKLTNFDDLASGLGLTVTGDVNSALIMVGILFMVISLGLMIAFFYTNIKQKKFLTRRILGIATAVFYILGFILANSALKTTGISVTSNLYMLLGIVLAAATLPFTAMMDKERYKAFSIINILIFIIISAFILVPLWKVIVDSLDASAGYGMKLWPAKFDLEGYRTVLTYPTIVKPFLVSVLTTVAGTALGLILSTLGAYVLVQFDMPGRNFFANILLFTLIFQAGMIPVYLNLQNLGILNTLWAVILPMSINVYNLVLMRNFFEGIPSSLIESAQIDGCSPMGIFVRIVLPLSKAALASIGLMFAVAFWNDYTTFKLYVMDTNLYNFQMKLRAMIFSSDLPNNNSISENTLQNAAIMVAIIPFMIIYPFCQKYFVKGVNVGAVKE